MDTVDIGLPQDCQQILGPYHHSLHGHGLYLRLHALLADLHRSRVRTANEEKSPYSLGLLFQCFFSSSKVGFTLLDIVGGDSIWLGSSS
ncbi:hypothetical protein J6590_099963 [Homalodisca vitripennis]|nr:hypothetical protein J6590_099963 [Homalodisca vitripennis]